MWNKKLRSLPYDRAFRRYLILKNYWNRGNVYFRIPQDFIQFFFMANVWFAVVFEGVNSLLIGGIVLLLAIILFVVGYFDVKWKGINREISFGNEFNPEMVKLVKNVDGKKNG